MEWKLKQTQDLGSGIKPRSCVEAMNFIQVQFQHLMPSANLPGCQPSVCWVARCCRAYPVTPSL